MLVQVMSVCSFEMVANKIKSLIMKVIFRNSSLVFEMINTDTRVEDAISAKTSGTWAENKTISNTYANNYTALGLITIKNGEKITFSTTVYPGNGGVKMGYAWNAEGTLLETFSGTGSSTALFTELYSNNTGNDVLIGINCKTADIDSLSIKISK